MKGIEVKKNITAYFDNKEIKLKPKHLYLLTDQV